MKFVLLFITLFCSQCFASQVLSGNQVVLPLKSIPMALSLDKLTTVEQDSVANLLVENLFKLDNGFEVNPVVASNVKWIEPRHLQIKIKDRLFSDGSVVKLEHVILSLNRCIKSSNQTLTTALQSIVGFNLSKKTISGIVPDYERNQINIHLNHPSPLLTDTLVLSDCGITKYFDRSDFYTDAIGTGAYVLSSKTSTELNLKRNPYHLNEGLLPSKIIFKTTSSYGNFNEMKNIFDLIRSEEDVEDAKFNKYEYYQLGTYKLFLNHSTYPFNNPVIRKALEKSIDFNKLFESMRWDKNLMQEGLFPYGIRGYKKRSQSEKDMMLAADMLGKLGYNKSKKIKFKITISKSAKWELEKEAWRIALENSLFDTELQVVDQSELFSIRDRGDFDALRMTKTPGSIEPHRLLSSYLSDSNQNPSKSKNKVCDKFIKKAFEINDSELRNLAYLKAEKCLMDDVLFIPITSIPKSYIYIRKPWSLRGKSRFNLRPFDVSSWTRDE